MTEKAPLTIVGIRVQNVKKVELVEIRPTPTGMIQIRGENENGKTSFIDAAAVTLGGAKLNPSEPIRQGAEFGECEIDLGELRIRRRWTDPKDRTKTSLIVENAEGMRYQSAQAILDGLTAEMADPIRFQNMNNADQVRQVLGMVDLGIDLEESKRREKKASDQRKDYGKDVKRLQGAFDSLQAEVQGEAPERISVTTLLREMEDARSENFNTQKCRNNVESAGKEYEEAGDSYAKGEEYIAEIEAKLANAKARLVEVGESVQERNAALKHAENVLASRKIVDLAPMEARLESAESVNAEAAKHDQLAERKAELQEAKEQRDTTESDVLTIRKERTTALSAVKFPVKGMGYDPENMWLTLNGVPFSDASSAEQLTASAMLAMASGARIQVLFARDGSLLDAKHKMLLAKLVADAGWQLWIEIVDDTADGPGVFISEGLATGPMAVLQAEPEEAEVEES